MVRICYFVLFSVGWGKPQLPLADFLESRLSFRTRGEAVERNIGTSLGAPSSLHRGLITRGSPLEAQFHMKGQVRVVEAAFPLRASWDGLAGYEPAVSPSRNWACGAEQRAQSHRWGMRSGSLRGDRQTAHAGIQGGIGWGSKERGTSCNLSQQAISSLSDAKRTPWVKG